MSCRGEGSVVSTAGLMVDWLEQLSPGVIAADSALDAQLTQLFAEHPAPPAAHGPVLHGVGPLLESKGVAGGVRDQPYLLALLVHRGSWAHIRAVVQRLLQPRGGATRSVHPSLMSIRRSLK